MTNWNKVITALEFAAQRHKGQTRKGKNKSPYINHPISVMSTLSKFGEDSENLLAAAALHDVIEDTAKQKEEIARLSSIIEDRFGSIVLKIVLEVSDDKSLPYQERKHLQVINTPQLSDDAKKLKIADKTCNISDLMMDPPLGWSKERKIAYLEWAKQVIEGARGVNYKLEKHFDAMVQESYNKLTD